MIEPKPPGYHTDKVFTPADMDAAIAREREACAKVCDIHARGWEMHPGQNPQAGFIATSNCAAAIRARGETK